MKIEELIRGILPDKDNYLYGFANLKSLIDRGYEDFHYAIVLARKLDYNIVDAICAGPTLEYYSHYMEINEELKSTISDLSIILKKNHADSIIINPTTNDKELNKDFDETLDFGFSHKMAATRAGLGWIGKTGLLITREYGPRVRLVTLLTDLTLPSPITVYDESKCGS